MDQLAFLDLVRSKGYDISSEMYSVYSEIMFIFTNYEFTYNYVLGSAHEDIQAAEEPGMHLLIEPIILPSVANALFIGMYGDVEASLNIICTAHANEKGARLKFKDIAGSGIVRAADYLSKVIDIDVKSTVEWNTLKHWNNVRNILVHNNGVIRNTNDEDSIRILQLKTNPKYNKVYLTIDDCDKFHLLIIDVFKKCI